MAASYPSSRNGCEQFVGLFDRRGQIRIGKKRDFPARFQHAVAHAESFSPVSLRSRPGEGRDIFARLAAYDFGSPVGRTVIDDDDLRLVGRACK